MNESTQNNSIGQFDLEAISEYESIDARSVFLAYRLILGRRPENKSRIDSHLSAPSIDLLRKIFMNSREFESQARHMIFTKEAERFCRKYEQEGLSLNRSSLDIKIMQTCDPKIYLSMLLQSQRVTLEYVRRKQLIYELFVGIKRGHFPHHAMLNRIFMLNEQIDSGYQGWLFYLDADTVIYDLDFDIQQYLNDKSDFAFIFARADSSESCPYWNVNDGIFFANLRHPICVEIVRKWKRFYDEQFIDSDYIHSPKWNDITNDQTSLHDVLKIPYYQKYIHSHAENSSIFNSGSAIFVRQFIRADHSSTDEESFESRLRQMRQEIDRVLERAE